MARIVVLLLSIALLSVSFIFISNSYDESFRANIIDNKETQTVDIPFTLSAINHDIFPSGTYSYGSWVWQNQGSDPHVQNHGNEFSMGQNENPLLTSGGSYSGRFYSDAVSYSGPPLTSVTTEINPRTYWPLSLWPDGDCNYELDLVIQKYSGGSSWIDMGTWNNAWTYVGTQTNPPAVSKSDWGAGVVDGPGLYRFEIYMLVNPPDFCMMGIDTYWLYIEDFALFGEDNVAPTWVEPPTDQIIEFGNSISYDLNATDSAGIDQWWINDTATFVIDSSGVITNISPLSVGDYGIEVYVNDTQTNVKSETFQVNVRDTIDPTWDQIPENQETLLDLPFSYNLNSSDLSGIDHYWVNDTSNFVIDSSGILSNNSILMDIVYDLEIRAYDPHGNFASATILVSSVNPVPIWDESPIDQVMECGSSLHYDVNASSYFGIDDYWLNDTVHFAINSNGLLTNISLIPVGIYGLEVRAYDPYGRYCSILIVVICEDTLPPEWTEPPQDQIIEYGATFICDLNATDPSGIDQWWVDDTVHFVIDWLGQVRTVGVLEPGIYGLRVYVSDIYGHTLWVAITVEVVPATTTTTTTTTITTTTTTTTTTTGIIDGGMDPLMTLVLGAGIGGAAVVVIVLMFLRRKS